MTGAGADRGAASLWTAGGILVLVTIAAVVIGYGAAVVTRHRAAGAADLAALAAASRAPSGERQACATAGWVADRMRVQLRTCRLNGPTATVEIAAEPPGVLAGFGAAQVWARAGPVGGAD